MTGLLKRPDLPTPPAGKETWRVQWPDGRIERFATEHQAHDRYVNCCAGRKRPPGLRLLEKTRSGWLVRSQIVGRAAAARRAGAGSPAGMSTAQREAVFRRAGRSMSTAERVAHMRRIGLPPRQPRLHPSHDMPYLVFTPPRRPR